MRQTVLNDILEIQMSSIASCEKMKEALEIRITLINSGYSSKSEYEKNECDILRMKSELHIAKLTDLIFEKRNEFTESFSRYIEELEFDDKNIE